MHKRSNEVSLAELISAVMLLEWAQEEHQAAPWCIRVTLIIHHQQEEEQSSSESLPNYMVPKTKGD